MPKRQPNSEQRDSILGLQQRVAEGSQIVFFDSVPDMGNKDFLVNRLVKRADGATVRLMYRVKPNGSVEGV